MKKFLIFLCLICLSGCVANDKDFCDGCDEQETNAKVQQMREKYPEDKIYIREDAFSKGHGSTYKIKHIVSEDYKHGINLFNEYGNFGFYTYSELGDIISFEEYAKKIEKQASEIEAKLAQERNIFEVLHFFDITYFDERRDEPNGVAKILVPYRCENSDPRLLCINILYKTSIDMNINKRCLFSNYPNASIKDWYMDESDDCIVARRKASTSKISFFNYKKYLPVNSKIKTEDDFIKLYLLYKNIYKNNPTYAKYWCGYSTACERDYIQEFVMNKCYKSSELTTQEIEKCDQEKKEFITNFVFGKAPKCSVKYSEKYKKWKSCKFSSQEWCSYINNNPNLFWVVNLCVPDKISD